MECVLGEMAALFGALQKDSCSCASTSKIIKGLWVCGFGGLGMCLADYIICSSCWRERQPVRYFELAVGIVQEHP